MNELKDKAKTAYIYARTSSDDSDFDRGKAREEGSRTKDIRRKESIDEQLRLCRSKCEAMGLTIIGEFVDAGFSGRMYPAGFEQPNDADCDEYFEKHIKRKQKKTRPEFGKLLAAERADCLVVRDVSRIVRPYRDSFVAKVIWQRLGRKKIRLVTTEEGEIDQDKFHDRLVRDLRMQIEDEAKQKEIQRCKQSLDAKKNAGSLASGVRCFGFDSDPNRKANEPPRVIPNEEELKTVRLIFDKYLSGMPLLQIACLLNDTLKITTKKGHTWFVHQIRNVLLRPCYAGLQYNTSHELIESRVFPSGDQATISPDEFRKVLASFAKRERTTVKIDPQAPGPAIGSQRAGGVCHPFSGLVKCGICGRHMYISQHINPYYKTKIPVSTYSYVCKTASSTKDPAYKLCASVRIKEHYPEKSLELGITPNGNGLIEALFPLLFGGYIAHYIDRINATPALAEKRQQLQYELEQLKETEEVLFSQMDRKIIDEEQFAAGMKRHREKRAALRKQLADVEQTINRLGSNSAAIPNKIFLDPQEVPRETMKELAHDIFESIVVFPDRITVTLKKTSLKKTGHPPSFDLARIRTRNSRDLPFWKARTNSKGITQESMIGVTYFYPSTQAGLYRNISIAYHDAHLEVLCVGENISIDRKKSRNPSMPAQTSFDKYLQTELGEPPSYGRTLELNSHAFFGSLVTTYSDPSEVQAELNNPSPETGDET